MRRPRVQFTVRRAMVLVAVAAILLGLGAWSSRRSERSRQLAILHIYAWRSNDLAAAAGSASGRERAAYHAMMVEKYRRAARHLWDDGADGIYLFNFFTTRENGPAAFEPPFEVLRDLGDRNKLGARSQPDHSPAGAHNKSLGSIFNNDIDNILSVLSGAKTTPAEYKKAVLHLLDAKPGVLAQNVPLTLWTRFIGPKKAMMPIPRYTKDKVIQIKALAEAGALRAVIDRVHPLEEVVDATRYVETEQKTGNVVLAVRSAE